MGLSLAWMLGWVGSMTFLQKETVWQNLASQPLGYWQINWSRMLQLGHSNYIASFESPELLTNALVALMYMWELASYIQEDKKPL